MKEGVDMTKKKMTLNDMRAFHFARERQIWCLQGALRQFKYGNTIPMWDCLLGWAEQKYIAEQIAKKFDALDWLDLLAVIDGEIP